jgi:hypothetical protein
MLTPAKNATRSKIREMARELGLPPYGTAMSPALTNGNNKLKKEKKKKKEREKQRKLKKGYKEFAQYAPRKRGRGLKKKKKATV